MFQRVAIAGIGICMLGGVVLGAHSANLLTNPGFEGGTGADGVPKGWIAYTPNDVAKCVVTTDVKHTGTFSACVETTYDINAMLVSDPPIPVAPGEKLTLRVWCRASNTGTSNSGSLAVNAGFLNDQSQYVAWKKTRQPTPLAGEWAPVEFEAEVPASASFVTFQLGLKLMTGTTWWDDAELVTDSPLAARFRLPVATLDPGESQVPLVLLNRDRKSAGSEVTISVAPGRQIFPEKLTTDAVTTMLVTVSPGKRGKGKLTATIERDGKPVFEAKRSITVPPDLVLEPLLPTHFCVEDSGPARLEGRFWVHEPPGKRKRSSVRCELTDSTGKVLADWTTTSLGTNPLLFNLDLPTRPTAPANYTVTATLLRGSNVISSATQDWHVIHRSQAQTQMDDKGRLVVGGELFFPIGIYMGTRYKELAGSGFNVTEYYNAFHFPPEGPADNQRVKDFLDEAQQAGFKTLTFISHSLTDRLSDDEALRRIRIFRNHPATLVWYQEEAVARGIRPLSWLCDHYQMLKKEAPEHPVLMGDTRDVSKNIKDRSTMFPDECMDIGIWWWYPIPMRPKENTEGWEGEATDRFELVPPTFLTLAKTTKPIWVAAQCYRKADFSDGRFPTPEEYRAQAYLSVIHGAKGLFFYTGVGEQNMGILNKPEEGHWDYLKKLTLELNDMSPVFLADDATDTMSVEPTSAPISLRLKQVGSKKVLLAANRIAAPVKAVIRGDSIRAGAIPVRFETRTIQTSTPGEFRDIFDKYAVHIYELE